MVWYMFSIQIGQKKKKIWKMPKFSYISPFLKKATWNFVHIFIKCSYAYSPFFDSSKVFLENIEKQKNVHFKYFQKIKI